MSYLLLALIFIAFFICVAIVSLLIMAIGVYFTLRVVGE
jgi:hypothetical protein